jgi:hypothetical protein
VHLEILKNFHYYLVIVLNLLFLQNDLVVVERVIVFDVHHYLLVLVKVVVVVLVLHYFQTDDDDECVLVIVVHQVMAEAVKWYVVEHVQMLLKDELIVHQSRVNDDDDVHRNVLMILAMKVVDEDPREIGLKQDLENK